MPAVLPNPFAAASEIVVDLPKSAPETSAPQNTAEREPAMMLASPGADAFQPDLTLLWHALTDWHAPEDDDLPIFIAAPSPDYLQHVLGEIAPIIAACGRGR